jgi:hypothetical protein
MLPGRKSAGHPVDIATGVVDSLYEDINIPGRFPLKWDRRYSTALLDTIDGPLGAGWTASFFSTLKQTEDGYEFISPEGDLEFFNDPENMIGAGNSITVLSSFQELRKKGEQFILTQWDVQSYEITRLIFSKGKIGELWPLQRIENATGQGLDLFYDKNGRLSKIHQSVEKRDLILAYNDHACSGG